MSALAPPGWLDRLGRFDWHTLSVPRAVRGGLGVTLPLVVGWLTGHVQYGAYAALGALPAGFASFEGQTRSRVAGVLVASAGMALATFVGATTAAGLPWLLPLVVGIWAYATGLTVSLGPLANVAVLQWAVALLIAMGLPSSPADAAVRSGFVLAGGLLQAALVALSWTLLPGAREHSSLAAAYDALAGDAWGLAEHPSAGLPPRSFEAGAVLGDPNPLLPDSRRLMLLDLLEDAERVRAALAPLGTAGSGRQGADARALLQDAAVALEFVSWALSAQRRERLTFAGMLDVRVASWAIPAEAPWRWSAEALAERLRAIAHKLQTLDVPRPQPREAAAATPEATPAPAPGLIQATLSRLRGHLSPSTEAGRHALRLGIAAACAQALMQWTGLPEGRWVALTLLIVLKPDYGSTFGRGLSRALGTIVGACAAAAIAWATHSSGWFVAACAVSVTLAYAVFRVNYLLYSVPLTTFILVLLTLLGSPSASSDEARVVCTLIGSALGLLAYLAWPTWKGATAQHDFATLLEAHRDYATALLHAFAHPGSVEAARLRATQAAARRARSDAEAAAARLAIERPRAPFTPELAERLLGTAAQLAAAELALHTLVLSGHHAEREGTWPDGFATAVDDAISAMAAALRRLEAPREMPALLPPKADPAASDSGHSRAFLAVVEGLIDALDTAHGLLSEVLPAPVMAR